MPSFRVLYLGHNGKQDWHGVRRCPYTVGSSAWDTAGRPELTTVEQADQFTSKSSAEALRREYEKIHGGSRTVLRSIQ